MEFNANFTVSLRQSQSKCYRDALAAEIAAGRDLDADFYSKCRINHPLILAYKARILGGRRYCKEYADWTTFLIEKYGQKRDCLSLGSGIGRVERFLIENGFTEKFDTIELNPYMNRVASGVQPRINVQSEDLNFVQLPQERYDFILCHAVLHHLINLEHVLFQVNRALKHDGLLLIYEYVGETRWQFAPERIRTLKRMLPERDYRIPQAWEVRGFESVRSGDLLALIEQQFGTVCEQKVCYGGIYFPFLTCTKQETDRDLERIVALDEQLSKTDEIQPCYLMGVYRKSSSPQISATPWSDTQLAERLAPPSPLHAKVHAFLSESSLGPYLRWAKRLIFRGNKS